MRSKKKIYLLMLLILFLTGCKDQTYTVTFDTLGGNKMDSITVNSGETIDSIAKPQKEGYLFVSWLKNGIEYNPKNPIKEDLTLTANWIEAPKIFEYYTITYVIKDKTEKVTVREQDLAPEIKAPEIENYIFLGWYVGEEKFDFNTPITKDIALVAKYELNVVTVKYELDGGLGLATETIPKNTTIPIPNIPTKEGYKFLKWTLDDKEFSFDTKITKDITLKAVWELIEFVKVEFDTDGGNQIESKTIEKYQKLDNLPTPEKEGYTFKEWQLNNETFSIDTVIENDIILKAIYDISLDIPKEEIETQE